MNISSSAQCQDRVANRWLRVEGIVSFITGGMPISQICLARDLGCSSLKTTAYKVAEREGIIVTTAAAAMWVAIDDARSIRGILEVRPITLAAIAYV